MPKPHRPLSNETHLEAAARLILDRTKNLYYSAPRGTLNRLEAIARELLRIEESL